MNVRKQVDYSAMFMALDVLISAGLPQMKLYCEIGRVVSDRPEKGAAVMAAEYLHNTYPDTSGFSPRNLRRMREFYRTYEAAPEILAEAMTIGWTQNVVILEADLTFQEKFWYIQAVKEFGWSKLKLLEKIGSGAHLEVPFDFQNKMCYTEEKSRTKQPVLRQVHHCRHRVNQRTNLSSIPPQARQTRHWLYWQNGPPRYRKVS